MPNPHYTARLKPDQARGVDQYADDKDIDKSEVIRRAVTRLLDAEGYPRGEMVQDGGHKPVVRPFIEQLATLAALAAVAFAAGALVDLVSLLTGAVFGLSYLVIATVAVVLLYSRVPDRLDWYLARAGYQVRRRLGVAG